VENGDFWVVVDFEVGPHSSLLVDDFERASSEHWRDFLRANRANLSQQEDQ
jgi:hypothetical protein